MVKTLFFNGEILTNNIDLLFLYVLILYKTKQSKITAHVDAAQLLFYTRAKEIIVQTI